MLNRNEVVDLYRKRARYYDLTANLYYLIGFREWAYRKQATEALDLGPGDTVVEIGCGTGINFSMLQEIIGPQGKIIGVDVTDAMLQQARQRVDEHGWRNVKLVHVDAAEFTYPTVVDGILSTFALSMMPEPNGIIQRGLQALKMHGRWVVLDLKLPGNALAALAPLLLPLVRPFGAAKDWLAKKSWIEINALLPDSLTELYCGFAYIAWGRSDHAQWPLVKVVVYKPFYT